MKACNAQAGDKKGDERKAFMSSCLKGDATSMTQQEKMKKCNADASAKSLKGDDRKAFMGECLKADHKMEAPRRTLPMCTMEAAPEAADVRIWQIASWE